MSRSLADWLSYLEQLHPTAIDMGLERVRVVADRLGLTRPAPKVITVTGTNGKGSTCTFLTALLSEQGLRVGVYSSPHLLRYNERVRIAGEQAGDDQLCVAFEAVEQARGEVSLTYFEMGTLAAFWLFERAQLDAAVLEVGLGGRLDAVNLVDADVAVITNVGLDHAEWLGTTRDSVATEKAGIMRTGRPVVCGDLQPPLPLLQRARQLGAPLSLRGRDYDLAVTDQGWDWRGIDAQGETLELHGLSQPSLPLENAALALQAFALLGLPWQERSIRQALSAARLLGRIDRRSLCWRGRELALLMDVGHNPHAAQYLAGQLTERPVTGRRLAVFGLLADKDLEGVIEPLLPLISHWAVAPLPTGRSRSVADLRTALLEHGAAVSEHADVCAALEAQCERALPGDEIVLFGSFYTVSEALDWLNRR